MKQLRTGILWSNVAAVVAILFWQWCDQPAMYYIHELNLQLNDNVWIKGFQQLGKAYVPIWLLLLWALLARRPRVALTGLLVLALVAVVVSPLKATIHRHRPHTVLSLQENPDKRVPYYNRCSMPSGDTTTVFALATAVLPYVARPMIPMLFITAGLIASLRVLSLDHFLSDITIGALLGVWIGWLGRRLADKILPTDLSAWEAPWLRYSTAALICIMPMLVGLYERFNPLMAFLKVYGPVLLIVLTALYLNRTFLRPALDNAKT